MQLNAKLSTVEVSSDQNIKINTDEKERIKFLTLSSHKNINKL